jgi:hypothetical protein
MAIPPFTQGYPPDGSSLGNTKTTMRDNLDGEFLVVGVDHQTQNTIFPGAAGSHTKVSLRNTASTITPTLPPGIFGGGYETLYSQPAGSTPLGPLGEIFYSRAGAAGIQLTGPGTPVKTATTITTFIPGGILVQSGFVQSTASTGIVVFPQTYPISLISVTFGMIVSNGSTTGHAGQIYYVEDIININTQFTWRQADLSADATGFFWTAIGY